MAGHLPSGEHYAAAAACKPEEELGIRGEAPLEALFDLAASPATGHEVVGVYRIMTVKTPCPDPGEILAARWCTPAELSAWIKRETAVFTTSFRLIWDRRRAE